MNEVFRQYLRKFVLVFFDDTLIYSVDWDSHLIHLHQVLQLLDTHKLFAKFSKCQFGVSRVAYLGHIITAEGMAADPEKIQAIQSRPIPTSVTSLRGFLGLTGYYKKFVQHYASIASPLTDLLKKNIFTWGPTVQNAFTALQRAMISLPTLAIPNFSLVFYVTTDALGIAVGAVLSQNTYPLAFYSKKLCPKMQVALAYEREMYAITVTVKKMASLPTWKPFSQVQ